jgi:hypothetical protein
VGKGVFLLNDVPAMLNLDTVWRQVVSFMSWPLCTLGKSMMYSYLLHRRLVGPQNQSEYGSEEKNLCPCWQSNPNPLVIQPVTDLGLFYQVSIASVTQCHL